MGRRSSSEHLPTRTRGRVASPCRSASHPQGSEPISYSLGVEGAPGHGLQVLGQRRGEPAQCQHDHRHKPLAEPTLPRPGHLPGSRLHLGSPGASSANWPRLPVLRCALNRSGAHPPQSPALKCSLPPASVSLFSARRARRTHWAAVPNLGMGRGLRGLAPLVSPPHEARRGLCAPG